MSEIDIDYLKRKAKLLKHLNLSDRDYTKAVDYYDKMELENPLKALKLVVYGEPAAWNRAVKTSTHYYDSNVGSKAMIADQVLRQLGKDFSPIAGPVTATVYFYKAINKGTSNYMRILMEAGLILADKKPDVDNYIKNVMDALKGFLYVDDSQVTVAKVHKSTL